jgi:HlyD family secretion protein
MSTIATEQNRDLAEFLDTHRRTRRWVRLAGWGGATIIAVLLLLAVSAMRSRSANAAVQYESSPVTRGNLRVAVSATGNLAPTNKVEVGSELSGIIETVLVQENDRVQKGQVLAKLDTSKLNDEINRTGSSLVAAQAKLAEMEATLKESQVNLERLREVSKLSNGKVPSKTEMTTAEATLARSEADLASQRAAVSQEEAQLNSAKTDVYKASIRSPIDGVVLSRSVEPGQTVAASLQVATLFTLAQDLRQMELKVYVDEADVGSVRQGQKATFSVDAYPNRRFTASVSRVAYGSTTKDNVVYYSTVLEVNNEDLSLRPGMTATAAIATLERNGVLLAPNATLRFTPAGGAQAPDRRGFVARLMPGPPPDAAKPVTVAKGGTQQVWTLSNGQPVPISVTVGATDGQVTEVVGPDLREGMPLITNTVTETK